MAKALDAVFDSTSKWVPTEEGTYPAHISSLSTKEVNTRAGEAIVVNMTYKVAPEVVDYKQKLWEMDGYNYKKDSQGDKIPVMNGGGTQSEVSCEHLKDRTLYDNGFWVFTDTSSASKNQRYFELLENLGIKKLLCATGGSMGGMQLLQFCATFPDKAFSAVPIACSSSHSAQNIALNELARQAIMADPVWDNGKYVLKNVQPKNGLAVARMVGHISYLSEKGMQEKFGRKLQEKADYEFSFNADFQVESYLRHQGYAFVERFDANSILYITRAMDYFDLSKQYKGGLVEAFKNQDTKFLVISFSSDWLYTTKENKDIVIALNASGADVSYSEIVTDKGHDSFLLNEPEFLKTLKGFIDSMYEKFKNEKRI